jgi:hypothetical protein
VPFQERRDALLKRRRLIQKRVISSLGEAGSIQSRVSLYLNGRGLIQNRLAFCLNKIGLILNRTDLIQTKASSFKKQGLSLGNR